MGKGKKRSSTEVLETDAGFFDDLRQMEREVLMRHGDKEALALVDAEWAKAKAEAQADDE